MAQPDPVNTFLEEAEELLDKVEEVALDFESGDQGEDAIHELFRAFHTIKGSGAMFGFEGVANFTHHVETVLDQVRNGAFPLSSELLNLVLAAKDHIKELLEASVAKRPLPTEKGEQIILDLNAFSSGAEESAERALASSDKCEEIESSAKTFRVVFHPSSSILASGTNPQLLLNELRSLGECKITAHCDQIPALEETDPTSCYLWWEITLETTAGRNAIEDVFIFVADESQIEIEESGADSVIEAGDDSQNKSATAAEKKAQSNSKEVKDSSDVSQKTDGKASAVRVGSEKLDHLVNLVGELVMNQSRLQQAASRFDAPDLSAPVEEIERLVSELRESILGIRMMPIGTTFRKFKRLVHDLSAELGKEINLVIEGAETELDKTVLDNLGEPLVHLVRNSLDHGIEAREQRMKAGKNPCGTLRLRAEHTGSNVVVSIEDDGRGLNTRAIYEKALDKGLIPPDVNLSEKEIFNLIFLPGFSTSEQITKISGRGVGMDVVRRQIGLLRGSITIDSTPGVGTCFSLTLPLTLAIIDGLLVEAANEQFIIPMSAVTENVELLKTERSKNNGRNVVSVRGSLIPYIRLREAFDMEGELPDIERIVIVRHHEEFVGLVVDRVVGNHQTVIQSLGRFYHNITVVSGATIMGDGRVALILDVTGIVNFAESLCHAQ